MYQEEFLYTIGFKRFSYLKSASLNCWWRYRVIARDPITGHMTDEYHHNECTKFHHFPTYGSEGSRRVPLGKKKKELKNDSYKRQQTCNINCE